MPAATAGVREARAGFLDGERGISRSWRKNSRLSDSFFEIMPGFAGLQAARSDIDSFFDLPNVDIDFQVTYHPRLAVAPSGGVGNRVDVTVRPK